MPSTNTWSATGYPGSAGQKSITASGRERTWNNTVNYGALPKDEKPVNGYSDKQYKTQQSPLFYNRYKLTSGGSYTYAFGPALRWENGTISGSQDSLWESHFDWNSLRNSQLNEVIVKALVKMADAKVNVAVAYAEASKTSDLIFDTARRIDRAYRAFRKGDLRGVAQNLNITPKRLHKSWLEYKYGWMPLLMDVKGAAEFFAQQHVVRAPRFTVSAKELVTKTKSYTVTQPTYGSTTATHPINVLLTGTLETKVKVWCELSSPHLSAMQQLGLTNPALVAWELVPFSFVFDWFVSVGDWLTAMTAQQGVTIRRKMFSRIESGGYVATEPATTQVTAPYTYEIPASEWINSLRRYTRSIPDLSPFSLYPPVTNSFGFAKLVTSLALIQGTYRGNSRTSRI